MAQCRITLPITNGPSKLKLFFALAERLPNGEDHPLTFTLKSEREINVILRGLIMEDGSHECWLIQGYAVENEGWKPIKGFFRTSNRTGWLEYIDTLSSISSDKLINKNVEKIKLEPVIAKNNLHDPIAKWHPEGTPPDFSKTRF